MIETKRAAFAAPKSNCTQTLMTAWIIWALAAAFYSYEFFLRISPNVMIDELMLSFSVSALAVGNLSACYYYAYAVMQIPVGIIMDNFGVRLPLCCATVLVALSCFLLGTTSTLSIAAFARVLMGVGSAFAFVGCLKIAALWFSPQKFSVVVGLTNMLGVLGAICGEAPLAHWVGYLGWRLSMVFAGVLGLILTMFMFFIIKDPKAFTRIKGSHTQILKGLKTILQQPQTWFNAVFAGLIVAPVAAFAELWGVPFLQIDLRLDKPQAAALESLVFLGIACGGPLIGWLSGISKQRVPWLFAGTLVALVTLSLIIYLPLYNRLFAAGLLFLFGFSSSSMLLSFALNREMNPSEYSGVTVAFTNTVVMAAAAVFQPISGWLLDTQSSWINSHGAYVFALPAYHRALIILPLCQIVAFFVLFFIKETGCEQTA